MTTRMRRSFLYTPADSSRMMRKAPTVNADAVIYDLEDSVAAENKTDARENLRTVIPEIRRDQPDEAERTEFCVRINGVETDDWLSDVTAAAEAGMDTVHIPMVEHPWQVRVVVETATRLFDDPPEFFLLLETPLGIASGSEIAQTAAQLPHVTGISYGMSDYAVAIGASQKSSRVRTFLDPHVLSLAHIGGLDPVSPVFPDTTDESRLREIATNASKFGFVGQTVIHPDQVAVVNDVFTPSREEAERAKRLVDAFDAADVGRTVAEDVFMDEAQVKRYRGVVARYEQLTGSNL